MSGNIIQLNEQFIHNELKTIVKNSVEETLNALLDAEADKLVQAERYAREQTRKGYRAGHYERSCSTQAGDVTLKVPKLKGLTFESAIIQRYQRHECSVEEALVEMYLAGVSMRHVEIITEILWGQKVSAGTISNLNQKCFAQIEEWCSRKLTEKYLYVFIDGIFLKRCWGESFKNDSVLVAIGVTEDGCREVIGTAEGLKEDPESWKNFFVWLKSRGLDGVKLIIGDKNLGMVESIGEVFPNDRYQRCTVHMYRNIFSVVPRKTVKEVAKMLKAIYAQENKAAAKEKAKSVISRLREMKLNKAADKLENGLEETLTYMDFPSEHWLRIRTNNVIERVNREIKRRTRVIGTFPDGESALMLVCARLRYIASNDWGKKRYLNMKHLTDMLAEELYCEAKIS